MAGRGRDEQGDGVPGGSISAITAGKNSVNVNGPDSVWGLMRNREVGKASLGEKGEFGEPGLCSWGREGLLAGIHSFIHLCTHSTFCSLGPYPWRSSVCWDPGWGWDCNNCAWAGAALPSATKWPSPFPVKLGGFEPVCSSLSSAISPDLHASGHCTEPLLCVRTVPCSPRILTMHFRSRHCRSDLTDGG